MDAISIPPVMTNGPVNPWATCNHRLAAALAAQPLFQAGASRLDVIAFGHLGTIPLRTN